jgi:hypothetical protein
LAIDRGYAEGFGRIAPRKVLDAKGVFNVLKKLKTRKLNKMSRHRIEQYLLHGPTRFGSSLGTKSLRNAVKYQKMKDGAIVGWASKSSPRFGNAVQLGLRGWRNSMTWRGTQMYTDRQRRFFAAIGLPISKNKMYQKQPEAAFFGPLMAHKVRSGAVNRVFDQKLEAAIRRRIEKAMAKGAAA